MKIAFVVYQFPKLSETFILNQITGLIDMGHEVDIYAQSPSGEKIVHKEIADYDLLNRVFYYKEKMIPKKYSEYINWEYYQFLGYCGRMLKKFSPFIYHKLKKGFPDKQIKIEPEKNISADIKTKNYDIILCHFGSNGYHGLFLKESGILDGKIIVFFNGADMGWELVSKGDKLYDDLFAKSSLFIPICHFFEKKFLKFGYNPKKIKVHRVGVDCDKFNIIKKNKENNAIDILTVARFVEKKGLEYSIKAVAELLKKYPSLRYTIIGDGESQKSLKRLIKSLKAEKNIFLVGDKPREEVLDYLSKTDIFLLSSVTAKNGDNEGTPVSIMEAMASGIPIVSTYHSGIPEIVKDNVSGFLVPERNIDLLADKIEFLINNPNVREKMGKRGKEIIQKNFNIKKLNKQLVKIFEKVLNEK